MSILDLLKKVGMGALQGGLQAALCNLYPNSIMNVAAPIGIVDYYQGSFYAPNNSAQLYYLGGISIGQANGDLRFTTNVGPNWPWYNYTNFVPEPSQASSFTGSWQQRWYCVGGYFNSGVADSTEMLGMKFLASLSPPPGRLTEDPMVTLPCSAYTQVALQTCQADEYNPAAATVYSPFVEKFQLNPRSFNVNANLAMANNQNITTPQNLTNLADQTHVVNPTKSDSQTNLLFYHHQEMATGQDNSSLYWKAFGEFPFVNETTASADREARQDMQRNNWTSMTLILLSVSGSFAPGGTYGREGLYGRVTGHVTWELNEEISDAVGTRFVSNSKKIK